MIVINKHCSKLKNWSVEMPNPLYSKRSRRYTTYLNEEVQKVFQCLVVKKTKTNGGSRKPIRVGINQNNII